MSESRQKSRHGVAITLDEWERALAEAMGPIQAKPVPLGWVTVRDEADRAGIGYGTAQKRINERWRLGILERKEWPNPSGKGSPVFIYRPVKRK